MDVTLSHHDEAVVIRAAGVLDRSTAPDLRVAFEKAFAQDPQAVVGDLTDLRCPVLHDLALLLSVGDRAAESRDPLVFLAGATGTLAEQLSRLGLDRRFVLAPTVEDALAQVRLRPRPPVAKLRLVGLPRRVRAARRFAVDHCRAWGEPALCATVALVVSELSTSALRNGLAPEEVRLTLMPRRLRVTVRSRQDDELDPFWATPQRSSLGLFLVAGLSRACGTEPTFDGGELTWCLLDRTHEAHRLGRLPV